MHSKTVEMVNDERQCDFLVLRFCCWLESSAKLSEKKDGYADALNFSRSCDSVRLLISACAWSNEELLLVCRLEVEVNED